MKRSKRKSKFPIFTFLLSLALLGTGFYYEYLSSPKRILKEALLNTNKEFDEIADMFNFDTGIINDYSKTSNIKISSNSNNYSPKISNEKYLNINYQNLIKNLNETSLKLTTITNTTNKTRLLTLSSTYQGEELLTYKKLIKNATEYYYDSNFSNNYINNGNNTYFESINKNITIYDNTKYLYKEIINSLIKNIDFSSFTNKLIEKDYNIVTLKMTSTDITKVLTNTLTELKNNQRLNTIITNYYKDFKKLKVPSISNDFTFQLNIYTDRYNYKIKKIDLTLNCNQNSYYITLAYEDINNITGIITKNQVEKYSYKYTRNKREKELTIFSQSNEKIGSIVLEKTNSGITFDTNIQNNDNELSINYIYNILNLEYEKKYQEQRQIMLRSFNKKDGMLNLDITINSNITSKNTNIYEDTSEAIIERTLSQEEKEKINNTLFDILYKLGE